MNEAAEIKSESADSEDQPKRKSRPQAIGEENGDDQTIRRKKAKIIFRKKTGDANAPWV